MRSDISREARAELISAVRTRYQGSAKVEKTRILDEFSALVGCHRKHAIRLLANGSSPPPPTAQAGRRVYDEAVREALIVAWEAADRVCGKRLKVMLPTLVGALERHGHLDLDPTVRQKLLEASAATLDRLLSPVRGKAGGRRKKRSAKRIGKKIPIRTFADWEDSQPGELEIDFVAHSGGSMAGNFIHSFVATDVASGWTECVPLLAREQSLVVEGLEVIRAQMPIPVLAIDSDNDSAFINDTVLAYCEGESIDFTRSRAHHKNDQAWIEQKNGAVVRRFVGHDRYAGVVAGQALAQLFQAVRLYVNYFQPSFKLREKVREGAKVKRSYFDPATPCDRLLARSAVDEATKDRLRIERDSLDPLELLHGIRNAQSALAALASPDSAAGPDRDSLDSFLAALPRLWQEGEVRPTHRKPSAPARRWRTRKDPFEGFWPDVLTWLQQEPDATGKSLFDRLANENPGRFKAGQLRTLQRRVREWREIMARELVYGCVGSTDASSQGEVSGMG